MIPHQMTAYRTATWEAAPRQWECDGPNMVPSHCDRAFQAARAQVRAVSHLSNINVTIRRSSSTTPVEASPFGSSANSPAAPDQALTPAQLEERCKKAFEEDHFDAQRELERYEREPVTVAHSEHVTDLVHYWEVCSSLLQTHNTLELTTLT